MYYALILSRFGLILGTTALVLSWIPIRFGRRWGLSRELASTLSLIGLGLLFFVWMWGAASGRL